jgi:hypothetical protein
MHSVKINFKAGFFVRAGCLDWVAKVIGLLGAILIAVPLYSLYWMLILSAKQKQNYGRAAQRPHFSAHKKAKTIIAR